MGEPQTILSFFQGWHFYTAPLMEKRDLTSDSSLEERRVRSFEKPPPNPSSPSTTRNAVGTDMIVVPSVIPENRQLLEINKSLSGMQAAQERILAKQQSDSKLVDNGVASRFLEVKASLDNAFKAFSTVNQEAIPRMSNTLEGSMTLCTTGMDNTNAVVERVSGSLLSSQKMIDAVASNLVNFQAKLDRESTSFAEDVRLKMDNINLNLTAVSREAGNMGPALTSQVNGGLLRVNKGLVE